MTSAALPAEPGVGASGPSASHGDPAPLRAAPGTLAVDARFLHASGIGRYLRELLSAWLREPPFETLALLGNADELHEFLDAAGAGEGRGDVTVVAHRGGFYSPAAQTSWLRARRLPGVREARATFFPHWDAPLVGMPRGAVVAVHDLIHFRVPEAFPLAKRAVAGPVLRRVVATAGRIVCGSHATAADLAAAFPRSRARLSVVPYGVTARFAGPPPGAPPVDGPYLLAVGNQKPHKNLAAAVAVLARVRAAGHPALRLAVVGRRFGAGDLVMEAARRAGVAEFVVPCGEVDDATLHRLYAGCACLLFPSRYEGFGLPVVEAMAAGAPVVASSTPAVAEAVGGVGPTFAPDDVDGMARETVRLLVDPGLRAERVARGRVRAAALSWRAAARETGALLQGGAASLVSLG